MLNGEAISYASKKQAVIAFLSTKIKFVVFSLTAQKATWL